MRNFISLTFSFFLFIFLFSSCKPDDRILCTDSKCDTYLAIWKDYFLNINDMSEEYFEDHIMPIESNIVANSNGQSFNIRYEVNIEWLTFEVRDRFQVFIDSNVTSFPQLNLNKGEFLFDDDIKKIIDIFAFESQVTRMASVENLNFSSHKKALSALQDVTGENVDFRRFEFKDARLTFDPFTDDKYIDTAAGERGGHPYMYGVKEVGDNDCVCGELDLVSGKGDDYPCECEIE